MTCVIYNFFFYCVYLNFTPRTYILFQIVLHLLLASWKPVFHYIARSKKKKSDHSVSFTLNPNKFPTCIPRPAGFRYWSTESLADFQTERSSSSLQEESKKLICFWYRRSAVANVWVDFYDRRVINLGFWLLQ